MLERHLIYLRRKAGVHKPWTDDPILQRVHFCNVYREYDKTTVYILGLMAMQPKLEGKLRASIVGRHINRPDSIAPVYEAVLHRVNNSGYKKKVEQAMNEVPFNAHAYKIHTREGLFSRSGVASACTQQLNRVVDALIPATSMLEAATALSPITNSGFLLYQVALDLWSAGAFVFEDFDETNWMNLGGGAWRGSLYLNGDYKYQGEVIIGTKWDSTPGRAEQEELHRQILLLTEMLRADWPLDWPVLTCHDVEFSLCEFDKYKRHQAGGKVKMRVFDGQG